MPRIQRTPLVPLSLFAAALVLSCGGAVCAQTFHMFAIGPAGTESNATAVGSSGAGIGFFTSNQGNAHRSFVVSGGTLTTVGPLSGDSQVDLFSISSAGVLLGVSYDLGELGVSAVKWENGVPTSLGAFFPRALNDAGDVVGSVTVVNASGIRSDHACRLRNGVLTDFLTLQNGSNSYAFSTNNVGQVVGRSDTANDAGSQGALWQGSPLQRIGLGTLGGNFSAAYDINDQGAIVGVSTNGSGQFRAVRFAVNAQGIVTARTDLGALPVEPVGPAAVAPWSYAYAINNGGWIVGSSSNKGVLWAGARMIDLNAAASPPAGWRIMAARDVNGSGDIVGQASGPDGYLHAVSIVPCFADTNRDGAISVADLFEYLDDWFASLGSACPLNALCPADFNLSGTVEVADLFAYLDAWFSQFGTNCPGF